MPLNLSFRKPTAAPWVDRRGAVAVEAALVLPMVLGLLFGLWEVGRFVLVGQTLNTAARRRGRLAAGGYTNSVPVTCAMVQQAVQDYLTASGFPNAAVTGSQVSVACKASTPWTIPIRLNRSIPFKWW